MVNQATDISDVGACLSYCTRLHVHYTFDRVLLFYTRIRGTPRILHNIRGYTRSRVWNQCNYTRLHVWARMRP